MDPKLTLDVSNIVFENSNVLKMIVNNIVFFNLYPLIYFSCYTGSICLYKHKITYFLIKVIIIITKYLYKVKSDVVRGEKL